MDQLLTWQINKCKDPNAPEPDAELNGGSDNGLQLTEPESTADTRLSETLAELLREKEPSEVRPGDKGNFWILEPHHMSSRLLACVADFGKVMCSHKVLVLCWH